VPEERLGSHAGGAIFQLGQERLAPDMIAEGTSSAVACATLDAGSNPFAATAAKRGELAAQCHLLRDLFGNAFNPVNHNSAWPEWNDGALVRLAQGIYDDRAFDRLPTLANALEDAGCAEPDLLSHLRSPGPHVRGCWAVDLLLGKEF
jgi:hypothetical protein